jgi:hypothetical protein
MKSGYKAASPTKSPSTGLHKPTWRPSSKPAEHRTLQTATATATRGAAGAAAAGQVKMRSTANVPPSKSPSAGMHKPTWKPSAKPVESMQSNGEETTSEDTTA